VRGLASLTQSTPAEIEALFELSKPVSVARKAPPRQGRPEPVGLELQIVRMLVAHPALALGLDEAALQAFDHFGAERPTPALPDWHWPRRWARTAPSRPCPSN
jgi:DNA primase